MRYKARGKRLVNRQGLIYGRMVLNGDRTQLLRTKGGWIQVYKKDIKKYKI